VFLLHVQLLPDRKGFLLDDSIGVRLGQICLNENPYPTLEFSLAKRASYVRLRHGLPGKSFISELETCLMPSPLKFYYGWALNGIRLLFMLSFE
jgi:hypothetical protein